MAWRHRASSLFWYHYRALPTAIQRQADKQFALLKTDPFHPSLHFKKVRTTRGLELWSARITLNHRAMAVKKDDGYVWFWIGGHKAYEGWIN